jgi:RimJ/RimL family protein N-acetyltransferase
MMTRLAPAPERLVGHGVLLRRSTTQDAAALFHAAHDPEVMRYLDWPAQMAQGEAWAFLDAAAQRWRDGHEYHWMIETVANAQVIGCMACRPRGHAVDFGFFLARAAWGKGHATEASRLLVDCLKDRPTIHRIWASTDVDNRRAAAVLGRVGLRREGLLRRATVRPNLDPLPRDSLIHALVRDDF